MSRIYLFLLPILLAACTTQEQVDLLVTNAKVYTVDADFSTVEAFAVKDGKFVSVGTTDELLRRFDAESILDAQGRAIFPGFIDAHCHFYGLGLNQQVADLSGTKSYDEVIERVIAFRETHPYDFVRGRGWDQNNWDRKAFPDKASLDSLFPDTAVVLQRIDGHAYLVNQKVLDLAGITAETQTEGGQIEVVDGRLTGILIDKPMELVDAILPAPTRATKTEALLTAQRICFDYGLTTVSDAGLDRAVIEQIDSLQQAGELAIRVYAMVSATPENLDYFLEKDLVKTEKLNVRSIKVYGDGALGSRGAALKKPYSDSADHYGAMVTSPEDLEKLALRIAATDFQMNTHAIGDSANAQVLRAYHKALGSELKNRRWRIEHAQIVDPADFEPFGKGVIPSVQPTHATSDMYWAENRVGSERIQSAYAYKTLLETTGIIALGTDFPVEQVNPFLTFYAAITRQDLEQYPDGGFQPQDALSREETLKGMTRWAAYANFEETEKGSIEPGKWADFIILDQDIMTVPIDRIPHSEVINTFVGGKRVK